MGLYIYIYYVYMRLPSVHLTHIFNWLRKLFEKKYTNAFDSGWILSFRGVSGKDHEIKCIYYVIILG